MTKELRPQKFQSAHIFICHGKACRKKKKRFKKLRKLFPQAHATKCMGICKGPVVLIKTKKKTLCFQKIRTKKDRYHIEKFYLLGKLSSKLKHQKTSKIKIRKKSRC